MSGFAALVEGAFGGYQFGEGLKDQRRKRKIEDERQQWAREDREYLGTKREWEQEDRRFTLSERDRAVRERERAEAEREANKAFYADVYDDAQRAYEIEGSPNPAAMAPDVAPASPAVPQGGGTGMSMRPRTAPAPGREAPGMMQPPAAPDAAPRRMRPPGAPVQTAPQQAPDRMAGIPQSFLTDPVISDRLSRSAMDPDQAWRNMPEDVKEQWRQADIEAGLAPGPAPSIASTAPTRPSAPMADVSPAAPRSMRPPTTRQSPTPPQSPQTAEIEATAAARSEDPNVEAGRAGAVTMSMRNPKGRQAKTQAATSFIETYQRVAVPQIIQRYLEQGEFDKARSFEEWVETTEAKQLQKDFGELTFSLAIGDLDATLDHLGDMYSSVNDGYTVNREQSRFEMGEGGQPQRLVVVIEDENGESFDWIVEDQGDLAAQILGVVNPQAAHEYLLERNLAAVAERSKKKADTVKPITRDELTAEVKRIQDDLIDQQETAALQPGSEFVMPSQQEIEQMALENLRARDAALSGAGRSFQPRQPMQDWVPTQ